jgi:aminotransferase
VSYAPGIAFAGGTCVPLKTRAEDDFRMTPEALRACLSPRTKALILPYPNNPPGVMGQEDLEAIARVLEGTNVTSSPTRSTPS